MRKEGNGFGKISMVCGLLSLVFFLMLINIPLAIAAIGIGTIQILHYKEKKSAIIGITAAILSILLMLVGWMILFWGTSQMDPSYLQNFQKNLMEEYYKQP